MAQDFSESPNLMGRPQKDEPAKPRDPFRVALGRNIQEARRGMSGRELAARVGIHWTTLSKIESGKADVDAALLVRIAAECGSTPAELLPGAAPARTAKRPEVSGTGSHSSDGVLATDERHYLAVAGQKVERDVAGIHKRLADLEAWRKSIERPPHTVRRRRG